MGVGAGSALPSIGAVAILLFCAPSVAELSPNGALLKRGDECSERIGPLAEQSKAVRSNTGAILVRGSDETRPVYLPSGPSERLSTRLYIPGCFLWALDDNDLWRQVRLLSDGRLATLDSEPIGNTKTVFDFAAFLLSMGLDNTEAGRGFLRRNRWATERVSFLAPGAPLRKSPLSGALPVPGRDHIPPRSMVELAGGDSLRSAPAFRPPFLTDDELPATTVQSQPLTIAPGARK